MVHKDGWIELEVSEFAEWLKSQRVVRAIKLIQLHHTASPDYANWSKRPDGIFWQSSMKNSHLDRGYSDIAQHFTICPNGQIVTGRSLNINPAGIKGANTGAICIEVFGNFDTGGDIMTVEQEHSILTVVSELLKRFNLSSKNITYHAWWTASGKSLGDYKRGSSAKTCPGTAFFGGNTKQAFESVFVPELKKYLSEEEIDMKEIERINEVLTLVGQDIQKLLTMVEGVAKENTRQNEIINLIGQDIQDIKERIGDK